MERLIREILKESLTDGTINYYNIGNLKFKTYNDFKRNIESKSYTIQQLYPIRYMGYAASFLEHIDELWHTGGEIYRILIVDNINNVNIKSLGHYWTVSKTNINNYIDNIKGDYEEGFLATDEYPWDSPLDEMCIVLVTAKTPPKNFNPNRVWGQFLEFPEEQEVYIEDPSLLSVVNVVEYKQ